MKHYTYDFIFLLSIFSLGVLATPSREEDLICHTSNISECYPRIFIPTEEFQIVHDDQAIPKGLHIRMNWRTGQKEAKLYDPSKDTDTMNAVEVTREAPEPEWTVDAKVTKSVASLDTDLTIVEEDDGSPKRGDPKDEPPTREDAKRQEQAILDEMRKAAMDGPIKPPVGSGGDAKLFADSKAELKAVYMERTKEYSASTQAAWTDLEEISHDVWWGLQLVKDERLVQLLFGQLLQASPVHAGGTDTLSPAARLLGTALQNNQAALDALERHAVDAYKNGGLAAGRPGAVLDLMDWTRLEQQPTPEAVRVRLRQQTSVVYMLSKSLSKDRFLAAFVEAELLRGLELAVATFPRHVPGAPDNSNFRRKVANLVADHIIIDEAARARLGAARGRDGSAGLKAVAEEDGSWAGPRFKRFLQDKAQSCGFLQDSFTLWSQNVDPAGGQTRESQRYDYVPERCDPSRYDVATGIRLRVPEQEQQEQAIKVEL